MPVRVNLTTFIDIASASGTAKVTALRRFKNRGDYDPRHDYWKRLRTAIVEYHESAEPDVLDLVANTAASNKRENYRQCVQAYKNWAGSSRYSWFDPPAGDWEHAGVLVRVSPELGLRRGQQRLAIKLYFKTEPLTKLRADVILHLLQTVLLPTGGCTDIGILDVRRSRLIQPTVEKPDIDAALRGEAGYIAAAWDSV